MEILETGKYYHIFNRANGSENLFRKEENYSFFLNKYKKYIIPIAETFAYCLMPNHFHFVLRMKDDKEIIDNLNLQGFQNLGGVISKKFSNFFNSYSKAYNKKYSKQGSLFNQNFKRKEIKTEQNLKQAINYINQNPVHHNFVEDPIKWEHSSFSAILGNNSAVIELANIFDLFGDKDNFLAYHRIMTNKIKQINLEI